MMQVVCHCYVENDINDNQSPVNRACCLIDASHKLVQFLFFHNLTNIRIPIDDGSDDLEAAWSSWMPNSWDKLRRLTFTKLALALQWDVEGSPFKDVSDVVIGNTVSFHKKKIEITLYPICRFYHDNTKLKYWVTEATDQQLKEALDVVYEDWSDDDLVSSDDEDYMDESESESESESECEDEGSEDEGSEDEGSEDEGSEDEDDDESS
jgi:hypothetical protein